MDWKGGGDQGWLACCNFLSFCFVCMCVSRKTLLVSHVMFMKEKRSYNVSKNDGSVGSKDMKNQIRRNPNPSAQYVCSERKGKN